MSEEENNTHDNLHSHDCCCGCSHSAHHDHDHGHNHHHCHDHSVSVENERKTLIIIILTVITMCAEIFFGYITKSMSLLADGYHMGTHALALGLAYIAYVLARKLKDSKSFNHGTEKIGTLAAYTSSIFLGTTGIWIIIEAVRRFLHPESINFSEAIIVAIIGLIVNSVCIFIMEFGEKHNHDDSAKDYNFMAAYYHILADALTSVLAIIALLCGKYLGWTAFDPIIGCLGGLLILNWSKNLIKGTVKILLDMK